MGRHLFSLHDVYTDTQLRGNLGPRQIFMLFSIGMHQLSRLYLIELSAAFEVFLPCKWGCIPQTSDMNYDGRRRFYYDGTTAIC